jgi:tetratricopeptide (TPR) repeat protein
LAQTELEGLERAFRDDDPRFAVVLSARAALRAVPALTFLLNRHRQFKSRESTRLILTVFRALQCSWYASVYPNRISSHWIHDAADAADAAARPIGSEGRTAIFVPSYAAYAAAGNNAPYTAAVAIEGAPAANHFAALSTAFPAGRRQTADRIEVRTREASTFDYEALRSGVSAHSLALRPLWSQRNELAWSRNAWGWLKGALYATGDDWQVWTDWYDARLEGRRVNESLEFARAAIPSGDWHKGPNTVNAQIKRLIVESTTQSESQVPAQGNTGTVYEKDHVASSAFPTSDFDVALEAYETTIKLFPHNLVAQVGRAETLRSMGRLEEALIAYETTIEVFPRDVVAHTGRAEMLRSMGRFEEALKAYESTINLFPDNVVAQVGRAETLRSLGQIDEALRAYNDTIERFPTSEVVRNGRAETLRELGRAEQVLTPPSAEAIPKPERGAVQFDASANGPIDLAAVSASGEHLQDDAARREDYAELRAKAVDLGSFGTNRLGRLGGPISRFLSLSENIDEVRLKLFWSRINSLRIILDSHEQASTSGAQSIEPDERRLEPSVAALLRDIVETINIFVIGDPGLMELDAARPGPQEIIFAKEEVAVLAPMLGEVINNPNVATEAARDVLKEQAANLQEAVESLHERQAADFGRRTIRNFVSELLRRTYAPVRAITRSETAFAWRGIREGAYRTIGGAVLTGIATDLAGMTDFHQSLIAFVTRHAEPLIAYAINAFQNPTLVEIINWIARLGP